MAGGFNVRDANLKVTRALPSGAANVTSNAIDLGVGTLSDFVANVELLITAPALNTTQQPDAKTMKYDIVMGDSSDLTSGPTTLVAAAITQTGAGGAGAAAATYRYRLPTNVKRYVGIKITGSASGDATAATATVELLA